MTIQSPHYEHDCEKCVFLGRSSDGYTDLYFCNASDGPTVVARYGSLGHQYTSLLVEMVPARGVWLNEAKKAAQTHGLLP